MGFNRDSRGRVKLTNMVFVIPRCCHFEGKLYIGKAFECKKLHYFFLRSGMAFLMSMVLPTTLCTPTITMSRARFSPRGPPTTLSTENGLMAPRGSIATLPRRRTVTSSQQGTTHIWPAPLDTCTTFLRSIHIANQRTYKVRGQIGLIFKWICRCSNIKMIQGLFKIWTERDHH